MWSRDNDVLSLNDRREKERKRDIYYIYLQTNCCDVQRRVSIVSFNLLPLRPSSNVVEKKGERR